MKHLTGSDDEPVNSAVTYSALRIGANIGPEALLGRLLEWFDGASPRRIRVLVNIWERLAEGVASGGNVESASEFFDQCFGHVESHEFARVVRAWIAAADAVESDSVRERCVNAIVKVAVSQPSRMVKLWYVTRPPIPDSDGYESGTDSTLRLLWTRIDESDPFLVRTEGTAR